MGALTLTLTLILTLTVLLQLHSEEIVSQDGTEAEDVTDEKTERYYQ